NQTLFQLGCSFRARGCTEAVILAALKEMNATQCQPPLGDDEVATIAASCTKYEAGQAREDTSQRQNWQRADSSRSSPGASLQWPQMHPEAFYGLAGEIVKTIEPHSESDPVALLIQLLIYFGVVIGRSAHYLVEATTHYTNLAACLVGRTSKSRKGTSYDHIE